MTENPVRVVLVHRAGLFRAGLADLLARYADIAVVGQFDCDDAVATRAGTLQPDVVLLDCQPPDLDSVEAMRRLRAEHPR
ncbi:MAG: response regulator transcription factor [Dehalococcoidia bacterium]